MYGTYANPNSLHPTIPRVDSLKIGSLRPFYESGDVGQLPPVAVIGDSLVLDGNTRTCLAVKYGLERTLVEVIEPGDVWTLPNTRFHYPYDLSLGLAQSSRQNAVERSIDNFSQLASTI